MLITILIIFALIMFAIPAVRSLVIDSKVDFTNSGLAFLTLAWLLMQGVL